MQVITIPSGMLEANAYLLTDPESGESALIDAPCADGRLWEEAVRRKNSIRYILLTHGHIDHIAGVQAIRDITGAKVGHPPGRRGLLAKQLASLAGPMGLPLQNHPHLQPDLLLEDGACLPLGKKRLRCSIPRDIPKAASVTAAQICSLLAILFSQAALGALIFRAATCLRSNSPAAA